MSLLRHVAMNNEYLLCGLLKYDPNDVDPIHVKSPLHLSADGGLLVCVQYFWRTHCFFHVLHQRYLQTKEAAQH